MLYIPGGEVVKLSGPCTAGVVHTHASLAAQIAALLTAWEWMPQDRCCCYRPAAAQSIDHTCIWPRGSIVGA